MAPHGIHNLIMLPTNHIINHTKLLTTWHSHSSTLTTLRYTHTPEPVTHIGHRWPEHWYRTNKACGHYCTVTHGVYTRLECTELVTEVLHVTQIGETLLCDSSSFAIIRNPYKPLPNKPCTRHNTFLNTSSIHLVFYFNISSRLQGARSLTFWLQSVISVLHIKIHW